MVNLIRAMEAQQMCRAGKKSGAAAFQRLEIYLRADTPHTGKNRVFLCFTPPEECFSCAESVLVRHSAEFSCLCGKLFSGRGAFLRRCRIRLHNGGDLIDAGEYLLGCARLFLRCLGNLFNRFVDKRSLFTDYLQGFCGGVGNLPTVRNCGDGALNEDGRVFCRFGGALGEISDLVCNNGEALAGTAGARCFDCRVQREYWSEKQCRQWP